MFYDGRMSSKWINDLILASSFFYETDNSLPLLMLVSFSEDPSLEVVYRMYWLCYHIHTYKKTQVCILITLTSI